MTEDAWLPAVTVGLPVRNAERTVVRALGSLLAQTYPNMSVLVSDNASDDGTGATLRQLAEDPRVTVVRQPDDIGMLANFEFVLHHAGGELFMWAAADDYWEPTFVEELVTLLRNAPAAGVAMSSVRSVDPEGHELERVVFDKHSSLAGKPRWWRAAQMMSVIPAPPVHWFVYGLFRRELLAGLLRRPFPQSRGGDRILMCEVALATEFVDTPRVLYVRTVQPTRLAHRYPDDPLGRAWRDPSGARRYYGELGRRLLTSRAIRRRHRFGIALPLWLVLIVRRRDQLRRGVAAR